jgi:DNA invertase Pin-like site-specific DNA recombinase
MVYGYARVSTEDQKLNEQLDALKLAGCTNKIFKEKVSTGKERSELEKTVSLLQKSDTLVPPNLIAFSHL